jgi:hypothetical protein
MKIINPLRHPKPSTSVKEKLSEDNPEQYIPPGIYCYDGDVRCPYWDSNDNQPDQYNGYCHYMKTGDWIDLKKGGTMLLWDQVKECGINDDEEIDNET